MKKKSYSFKRHFSLLLVFAMCLMGVTPVSAAETEAADAKIPIASAEDLAKIGKDASYPMNGDYVLAEDIDLSGRNWTPIGGSSGENYGLVSGERVFSGTFDGQGHRIDGLTINYSGSGNNQKTNVSGLFAMIGSDDPSDYAEVKNIVFTSVSITHTLGSGDTVGTLTGDANGYTNIDNIVVMSGSITVENGSTGRPDIIGVGGVIGQVRTNSQGVHLSNLYNAASVTVSNQVSASLYERCGGILGRIHQNAAIGSLTSCVNVGTVLFRGNTGYAINGISTTTNANANTANITNCYYLEGSGKSLGASESKTQQQLASQAILDILGSDCWMIKNDVLVPSISDGKVYTPIPSPEFAESEKASSVTKDFKVPLTFVSEEGEETIAWTSDSTVISIDNTTGVATVTGVLADTSVTLTATTSKSNRTKTVTVTVRSNLKVSVDKKYAKPGVTMTASVENAPADKIFAYQWSVGAKGQLETVSNAASYTPTEANLNKFITVTATLDGNVVDTVEIYCSKLPVVYINTEDGHGITSKTVYKDATMRVQGNENFQDETTLYDGAIEIRGRGNTTWNTSYNKLPYKIKLGKKTNLLGFGESKHWALLANYMDESLIRNTTSYDLAGKMGISPYLPSTHVELILNGVYAGNYQLVGNVRIDKSRVNIFNWEDVPEDVAKAIAKKDGLSKDEQNKLEDYLNRNMGWITSDSVTYNNKTYKISDYYTGIPKNADGSVNVSGGFLIELDAYYDEVSKFHTTSGQPIMLKNPEFINTNNELFASVRNYIQAVEDSFHAKDFYVDYDGGKKHYTDLVDMDSLVRYLILNEFYWNTETMKKSTYMYKDLDKKLVIGPLWDMDWTSNSLVSQGETSNYRVWMVTTAGQNAQRESWYRYLIGDPYFVQKMLDCYRENRENFNEIIKTGGIIDQDKKYLAESAAENYNWGYLQNRQNSDAKFDNATERLRTFLSNRLNWMDTQFASLDTLLASLGKYQSSNQISVTEDTSAGTTTSYTATVTNSSAAKVGFYINGILAGTADVAAGKASLTASDSYLEREDGAVNVVQVRAMDASGNLLSNGSINNYHTFTKESQAPELTGTVTVKGSAKVGSVLKAVTDTNNSGTPSYQWKADGVAISGAVTETYRLTENEVGKKITVEMTSSFETGTLTSSNETEAVTELLNDHVIINQVYGGGANDGTPVSHSFIELYNPTDEEISLDGYAIGYLSNGKNGKAEDEVKLVLDGAKIPSQTSYLIRCEAQDEATFTGILKIEAADKEWTQTLDNKRYRIILYNGEKAEDAVSVNEGIVEGLELPDGTISKQRAIRRNAFADTDNNTEDFTAVTYQDAKEMLVKAYKPRSLTDGAWEATEPEPEPEPEELTGAVSIRGNAIVGAILYADDGGITNPENAERILSYQWQADGADIGGATGEFFELTEAYIGKKISVVVKSSIETGSLSVAMAEAVKTVAAQREHIIINQVYGDGGKKDVPVSHSFIELYNPTSAEIDLSGYSIEYNSTTAAVSETIALSGKIPARASYMIRGAAAKASATAVQIEGFDQSCDLSIDNKQYSVVLKNGETKVDGVSVNEAPVEGEAALTNPVGDEIISKNKAVHRIGFIDTDNNVNDFEVLNYSKLTADLIAKTAPRKTADGAWGLTEGPIVKPDPDENKPSAELLNNANDALNEAQNILNNASKYDSQAIKSLENAKKELEEAVKANDAAKIQTAVSNLKNAMAIKPSDGNSNNQQQTKLPKVGTKFKYKNNWYKITKSKTKGGTVSFVKPVKKTVKTVTIPKEAVYGKIKFKVTEVAKNAFKNHKKLTKVTVGANVTKIGASAFMGDGKLKNIVIKTKSLKSVGKNALKGVHAKCKIKVPKKQKKSYIKKFKKKGQKSSVKVVG